MEHRLGSIAQPLLAGFGHTPLGYVNASSACTIDTFTSILDNAVLPGPAKVVWAQPVAQGGQSFDTSPPFPNNATNLPDLCAVKVEIQSSDNSAYNFGLFLPSQWNERMMTTGNGGFSGGINYPDMAAFSHYGFATVSTDTGHLSHVPDSSWALNQPDSIIDWGWRAMHGSVDLVKQIAAAYYGDAIQHSYYASCSTGGRQGLRSIQLFPEDFDGILVGAPAFWTNHLQTWSTWIAQQNLPDTDPKHISGPQYAAIVAEVMKQCDAQDGVSDGIVQDPKACDFNYHRLLCSTENVETTSCLTAAQLETLQKLYQPYTVDDRVMFPGFALGADPSILTLHANPLGYGFLQNFVYNDTSYTYQDYYHTDIEAADRVDPGDAQADDFDISAFTDRGGKVMMYHGWEDWAIPTGSSLHYYHETDNAMPDARLDDFFRLFLVPGMSHCAGSTRAPWYFGGGSQIHGMRNVTHSVPGYMDADHDAVMALVKWVEEGKAPEAIVATRFKDDTAPTVERQRPICAYPKVAAYKGNGDVDDEKSWTC